LLCITKKEIENPNYRIEKRGGVSGLKYIHIDDLFQMMQNCRLGIKYYGMVN